jgi:hypothetical protein
MHRLAVCICPLSQDPKKLVICLDYIVESDADDFHVHKIQSMRDMVEPDFPLRLCTSPEDQDLLTDASTWMIEQDRAGIRCVEGWNHWRSNARGF